MKGWALALGTAVAMEPIAAAVHRFIGHGPGWVLHRDHHEPTGRLERNDVIPAVFAAISMAGFAVGVSSPARRSLAFVALGTTAYGVAYGMVHDVYVHRRLPLLPRRVGVLEPLRRAHLEHHRDGGAPYGVLVPIRARRSDRPRLDRDRLDRDRGDGRSGRKTLPSPTSGMLQ